MSSGSIARTAKFAKKIDHLISRIGAGIIARHQGCRSIVLRFFVPRGGSMSANSIM
jgi:hypothetical protein